MRATPRSFVVILWSLVALAPLGASGCHVGDAGADDDAPADGNDDGDDATTGPDASTDDGTDDGGDDTTDEGDDEGDDDGGTIDVTQCRELVSEVTDTGHHPARYDYNEGEEKGCISAGCHDGSGGAAAPTFTVGGAIYRNITGGREVAGATVYITDADGKVLALPTAQNGFFYTTEPLTPPIRTQVTGGDCPTPPLPMAGGATGNCNGGGACHNQERQIYLED